MGKWRPTTTGGAYRAPTGFKSELRNPKSPIAMIRPLRQRHRQIVIALGAILPVAFTVGISVRNPVPKVATLPAGLVASPRAFAATIWERSDLFAKTAIRVRLVRENAISG